MPKLTCNITGSKYYITTEMLESRAAKDNITLPEFLSLYVCKKVELLLRKGYNIDNIRSLMDVSDEDAPKLTSEQTEKIIAAASDSSVRRVLANYEAVSSLAANESDPAVLKYINKLRGSVKA